MTLLSGGEQALTATALIFAVFLTNPSPVCVLDEVDAPLDDANVERYCDLLAAMARDTDTRFIVITHNPINHGADGPFVRRDHGRAGGVAARLGRSRDRRATGRSGLTAAPRNSRNPPKVQ